MIKRIACNVDDYQKFFALTEFDLTKKIIEFYGAFNSFNCGMAKRQCNIYSCDPLYSASLSELQKQEKLLEHELQKSFAEESFPFSFHTFATFEVMMQHHQQVATDFFADYANGVAAGRYLSCRLEQHDFAPKSFDVVLLHYLFAKPGLILEEVFRQLQTALQLAPEVRIFPLLDDNAQHAALLAPLCLLLQQNGFGVELKKVDFEWQTQGHVLLIVREQFCAV